MITGLESTAVPMLPEAEDPRRTRRLPTSAPHREPSKPARHHRERRRSGGRRPQGRTGGAETRWGTQKVARAPARIDTVIAMYLDNGFTTDIHSVRNPDKSSHTAQQSTGSG